MKSLIGKSGVDWSKAPEGTTHYKHSLFYRQHAGVWECHNDYWLKSSNIDSWFKDAVSKEEDLEMNKKEVSKQVSCIEDLEVGMFIKGTNNIIRVIIAVVGNKIKTCTFTMSAVILDTCRVNDYWDWREVVDAWSYTYSGEYTPIVKETEADIKIKELEATIGLAQKQLQEYKGMK